MLPHVLRLFPVPFSRILRYKMLSVPEPVQKGTCPPMIDEAVVS
jgi:hypothetical protein